MLKVKTENLLTIAGIVWLIAGANVAGMGISACAAFSGWAIIPVAIGALIVFAGFGGMFHKMMAKHVRRIRGYSDPWKSVFLFFDARGYLIMAFMMVLGVSLRAFGLVPLWFVAFFYTGLGLALAITGALFLAARFCDAGRIAAIHGGHRRSVH